MHELSICGAIADVVLRHAEHRRVDTVHLRVGRLRQVVPDTLSYCWGLVTDQTELAGSVLDVDDVPAAIECRTCGTTTELDELPLLLCSACRGVDVEVVTGEEFLITALDLREG